MTWAKADLQDVLPDKKGDGCPDPVVPTAYGDDGRYSAVGPGELMVEIIEEQPQEAGQQARTFRLGRAARC